MDYQTDIQPRLTALVRHGLTLAAGALMTHGVLAKSTEDAFISAGVAVAAFMGAVVWSFIQKELQTKRVQDALATPVAGTVSLDQAAALFAPIISEAISKAIPLPPTPPAVVVKPVITDGAGVDPDAPMPVSGGITPFKPPFGPAS